MTKYIKKVQEMILDGHSKVIHFYHSIFLNLKISIVYKLPVPVAVVFKVPSDQEFSNEM